MNTSIAHRPPGSSSSSTSRSQTSAERSFAVQQSIPASMSSSQSASVFGNSSYNSNSSPLTAQYGQFPFDAHTGSSSLYSQAVDAYTRSMRSLKSVDGTKPSEDGPLTSSASHTSRSHHSIASTDAQNLAQLKPAFGSTAVRFGASSASPKAGQSPRSRLHAPELQTGEASLHKGDAYAPIVTGSGAAAVSVSQSSPSDTNLASGSGVQASPKQRASSKTLSLPSTRNTGHGSARPEAAASRTSSSPSHHTGAAASKTPASHVLDQVLQAGGRASSSRATGPPNGPPTRATWTEFLGMRKPKVKDEARSPRTSESTRPANSPLDAAFAITPPVPEAATLLLGVPGPTANEALLAIIRPLTEVSLPGS